MTAPDPTLFPKSCAADSERASDFFERRRFGEWSDADEAELGAWLAESLLHRAAYLRLEGAIAYTEELLAFRPDGTKPKPERAAPDGDEKRILRRFVIPLLAAASIALVVLLAMPLVRYFIQPSDRSFSTDIGGRTLLKFADGTEIELNTDTAMRFRMTNEQRQVWLEKGEAWFHVAHNAANPFSVIVGHHRVTDLGTEFFVRRGSDQLEVGLLNGSASLSTEGAPTAMLAPGDDAVATPASTSVIRRTQQELADKLSWRRGMLVFRNKSLMEVANEINRYNSTKLVIADPSIAGIRISTELKSNDYEGFVRVAETALNLHADRQGNEILITRGQRDSTKLAIGTKHNP